MQPTPPEEESDNYFSACLAVSSMEVDASQLKVCATNLTRLAGKSWWLTKQVQSFAPDEMHNLEFEASIPVLA